MGTPPEPHRPPESDPHTCSHDVGPDNLESALCGNTILVVRHEPP